MLPHQLKEFYVYVHRQPITRTVFYVGKGWGSRASDFSNRTMRWLCLKGGRGDPIVEVVDHSMTEAEALDLELALIRFILDTGGALANIANSRPDRVRPTPPTPTPRKFTLRCIDHKLDFYDATEALEWLAMADQPETTEEEIIAATLDKRRKAAGVRWESINQGA